MCSSNARFCVSLVTPDATTNISNEAFQLSHFVAKPEMSVVLNSKGARQSAQYSSHVLMSNTAVNFYHFLRDSVFVFFYNLLSAFKSNFTLVVGGHYTSRKKHLYFVVSHPRRQM